jgi:hypothetical protein
MNTPVARSQPRGPKREGKGTRDLPVAAGRLVAHAGSEEELRRRLYKNGVELVRATVAHAIFERFEVTPI